jgi:hypothetical protein
VIDVYPAFSEELLEIATRKPNRKYQRTANTITSGGNRKPANANSSGAKGAR